MASNPFLAMGGGEAALNPFADIVDTADTPPGDNPFAASNPFAEFGLEPTAAPLDVFGALPEGARLFDPPAPEPPRVVLPPAKPTDLPLAPPVPLPLPPATQELILSVTGHMEYASSHLLGRLPPTRSPSPVSARDMASPEPDAADAPELEADREPPRPPRPPPPPRPGVPPAPQAAPQASPQADDINLFEAPAPPPPPARPTKEAILSLYSAPKREERQIDFLSDDLPEEPAVTAAAEPMDCSEPASEGNPFADAEAEPAPAPFSGTGVFSPGGAGRSPFEPAPATAEPEAGLASSPGAAMDPTPNVFSASPDALYTQSHDTFPDPQHSFLGSQHNYSESQDNFTGQNAFPEAQDMFSPSHITASEAHTLDMDTSHPDIAEDAFGATQATFSHSQDTFPASQDTFPGSHDPFPASQDTFTASHDPFPTTQDTFSESHDTFTASHDPFPASHDTFSGAQDTFPETQDIYPESHDAFPESQDAFDAFSAKFDSTAANHTNSGAWGDDGGAAPAPDASGFEAEAFDPFLSMGAPATRPGLEHAARSEDDQDESFSVFIRPPQPEGSPGASAPVPALAPPPRPAALDRANPFDQPGAANAAAAAAPDVHMAAAAEAEAARRGSAGSGAETPPTPLFDEDVSAPLEDFPRTKYAGPGWEMQLRQPNKKKITGQRFWKKVWVRLAQAGDAPVVQLRHAQGDREPFQELPLQACYSVSEIAAQQFDQFGKIFTVKLQYVFYKERPGVRPGQVTKAERITNRLSQFAAYAIQGDYAGVKEFGSDLRKLGLPVEHAPQVSQLFKLGSLSYEDLKQFSCCVEEALFRLAAHRDRALHYKLEEVQVTAVDELVVEQAADGAVQRQVARVRLFFLGFLSGMPDVELGVNDLRRQGREVVGRHDIIPVATEEWIRVEDVEFHACVQPDEFAASQLIRFKPPDACYFELMRFRVRPPKNRELPLQLKASWCVTGNKVELRADVLVPGFASRSLGQVPCEDVAIRFPIPESWIYLFRVEKHFRYGSVKSAHRRTGKVKGIERLLGAVDTLSESLIEVTSGQAKYEHQHRAIVWRMPRLPKEGQGAYTSHNLVSRMALTSFDQIPAQLAPHAHVEFTMPAAQVSHMTVRSISLQNHDRDPPEKYVRYLARHEYTVGIERTEGQSAPAYALAAARPPPPPAPAPAEPQPQPNPDPPSSDSDSD